MRSLPSLAGPLPAFDPEAAPAEPDPLFARWLSEAVEAGVVEPHAMTLSTVDPAGRPSARVLILKHLEGGRWAFASGSGSRKGKELANTPWAALTFYWPLLGRQVRVRGAVEAAGADESAADFLARSPGARGAGLIGNQSEPLTDFAERDRVLDESTARAAADPRLVAPEWTVYRVVADEVEFWQGEEHRRHIRLHYTRDAEGWARRLLWP
ncbi:pyridoxine/pyridoxamine 5'-phosphate oxidase [Amycolatopsis acidicola]|uniref:pyridoxine/pyridoxamine 5'-phosphate oxidase n=1 Tax=Amycolatopsis acidicola TaxID=2596893 RepID=UPI001FB6E3D8|nr:pyridoxal 5'-phosphate synthase [Amycolatopsis acidicola]